MQTIANQHIIVTTQLVIFPHSLPGRSTNCYAQTTILPKAIERPVTDKSIRQT